MLCYVIPVKLNGKPLWVEPQFYYNSSFYLSGGAGLGFDQYAQYLNVNVSDFNSAGSVLTVTGEFQNVSYFSITIYKTCTVFINNKIIGRGRQVEVIDYEMLTEEKNALNPYVVGKQFIHLSINYNINYPTHPNY